MKNWKDKVLGIFAGIGVMTLFMASNSQQPNLYGGTPESHVWEMKAVERQSADDRVYMFNKQTGEVRKYSSGGMVPGNLRSQYYQVMENNLEGDKRKD